MGTFSRHSVEYQAFDYDPVTEATQENRSTCFSVLIITRPGCSWPYYVFRVCRLWQVSAHCHNGECNSHQSQCRMWWGDEADDAVTYCYTILNIRAEFGGNCGYNFTSETYIPCSSEYVLFDSYLFYLLLNRARSKRTNRKKYTKQQHIQPR